LADFLSICISLLIEPEKERAAVYKAHDYSSRKNLNIYEEHDVNFDFTVQDEVLIGNDFEVKLKIAQGKKETAKRTVKYTMVIKDASYTGITGQNLDKLIGVIELGTSQGNYELKHENEKRLVG